jgi:hypothetical protein
VKRIQKMMQLALLQQQRHFRVGFLKDVRVTVTEQYELNDILDAGRSNI